MKASELLKTFSHLVHIEHCKPAILYRQDRKSKEGNHVGADGQCRPYLFLPHLLLTPVVHKFAIPLFHVVKLCESNIKRFCIEEF